MYSLYKTRLFAHDRNLSAHIQEHGLQTPLRINTPKLRWIDEKCLIDRKFLGVLTPNNGSEFEYMLMCEKLTILKILKSDNSEHMCIL